MSTDALTPVFITLGANVAPETNLPRAVRLLAEQVTVRAVSRVYRTAPIGADGQVAAGQGDFLNAAVLIETALPPLALRDEVLRPIEARLGRRRTADKYAPRPIDMDIALYGNLVTEAPLVLPDPDILTRAHTALPLADLAPDFVHPLTGQTLASIAARFAGQPGVVLDTTIKALG